MPRKRRNWPSENATVPSPRTRWSVPGGCASLPQWSAWQRKNQERSERYIAPVGQETLVLIGDSITEEWLGSGCGAQRRDFIDVPAVLDSRPFGSRWAGPVLLGISGDQTQHLLWRLTAGRELSAAMKADPLLVASLLIGTNNLGIGGMTPDATAAGIALVARTFLMEAPRARLLVNALHPRGDRKTLKLLCPDLCGEDGRPLPSFDTPIRRINALVKVAIANLAVGFPGRVRYCDCGGVFRNNDSRINGIVRRELMPDFVHPSAAGQLAWAECMAASLSEWPTSRPGYG